MEHHVALLDILGFRELIHNNDHPELMRIFDNFRVYVQRAIAGGKTTVDFRGRMVSDMTDVKVNSTIVSDSLVFWSMDEKASGLIALIECLHEFLRFCHNLPHIYLRGGLTGGSFHYEYTGAIRSSAGAMSTHPMMLGKALVDAYEIEKMLQIAGCIVTEDAIRIAKENDDIGFEGEWQRLIDEKKIIQYPMPFKPMPLPWPINWYAGIKRWTAGNKNNGFTYWTINWVQDILHPTHEELAAGFTSFKKSIKGKSAKQKLRHTMAYYDFVKAHVYKNEHYEPNTTKR